MLVRRSLYQSGIFSAEHLSVPVVIVGNLVVGGTGKTPFVLWLTDRLRASAFRPGIVSRGYRAMSEQPCEVPAGGDPARFGDEPVVLAERSGVPVWIGRDRAAAGRALLASHPSCDVIVCDDGLQHYRLARDFEIAIEDGRGFGNGLLLPAGPLRELPSRQVDAVVLNGAPPRPGTYQMKLVPVGIYRLRDPEHPIAIHGLRGKRLHAVAGIGDPSRFFATLESIGLTAIAHPFPDHHAFTSRDLEYADCDAILMTEKDAVKCRAFARSEWYAVRVAAAVDEGFVDVVTARLHGLKAA
jgi:tetraacyldisaccharide 4'-kinase